MEDQSCLNFDKFYYDYARFHDHWANKLIHVVWVPIITWTLGFFLALIHPIVPYIGATIMTIVYLSIRTRTGLFWLVWSFSGCYLCNLAAENRDLEVWGGYNMV